MNDPRPDGPGAAFVVRTDGRWLWAPVSSDLSSEIALTDLIERRRHAPASAPWVSTGSAVSPRFAPPVTAGAVLTPVPALVAIVTKDYLITEGPDGGLVLLDDVDLTLIDRIAGETHVSSLIEDLSDETDDDLLARLGSLVSAGQLRSNPVGEPESAAAVDSLGGDVGVPSVEKQPLWSAEGIDRAARSLRRTRSKLIAAVSAAEDPDQRPALGEALVGARSALRSARHSSVRSLGRARSALERSRLGERAVGPRPQPVEAPPREGSTVALTGAGDSDETATATSTGDPSRDESRIPVYAMWHEDVGPLLALGMLTATARVWHDGALNERYEIRRPETADSMLADLAKRSGPAVLLCSDYVWSLSANLDAARAAAALCPELIVIHGGPSAPKYQEDRIRFFEEHGEVADVVVRGEGEYVLCEMLDAVAAALPELPVALLREVPGICFVDPETGQVIATPDQDRIAALDALPSPYLTGEFDGIPGSAWTHCLSIETTRGCPYKCTFCDWGSATMSRIRKFDLDRVGAELQWAARVGVNAVQITDANFGIMERDVETARLVVRANQSVETGFVLSWSPAKNTTRHLTRIMDELIGGGVIVNSSISVQTTDKDVLDALRRSNISTSHFVELAASYRRRGYPLQGDLMLGLPEQTFKTYKTDLQFFLDHEIVSRTWPVQVLPNAPMNDPDYREEFGLVVGEGNLVRSTHSFTEADRSRMLRYRNIDIVAERLGLLRHVMRYLQWDLGIPATDVMERVLDVIEDEPERFPVLAWTFKYFDIHPTVAVGWSAFYEQVRQFLVEEFEGVDDDGRLRCVLELQRFLMPWPGRRFPSEITLAHDYLSYYRSATQSLFTTGLAGEPERPLGEYGPAVFTVTGDPLGLCENGISIVGDSRNQVVQGDFHVGGGIANELESPLMRILPVMSGLATPGIDDMLADRGSLEPDSQGHSIPVTLGRR